MIVTGWTNGSPLPSGAGYGVKVDFNDRNLYFRQSKSGKKAKKVAEDLGQYGLF
jgi:hypothetical protein